MAQITVLNKAGAVQQALNTKALDVHQLAQQSGATIKVGQSEVVKVEINPDQIAKIERVENNAVITLKNGEKISLEGFFDAADNRLVLQEGEKAWQVEGLQQAPAGELAISYLPVETASGLAIAESGGVSDSLLAWGAGLLGVGAIAGLAANSGGSGGGSPAPVDTTPPVAGTLALNGFEDSGKSATDHISRDQSFKLALTGQEAGSTVKYQLSSDGGKTWVDSTRDQSALADGVYQFRAVVTDKAGNTATSNVETVTVDRQTTAGSLSLTSLNDTGSSATDHITRDHSFKLALTGQEAGTTVKYQLSTDGGKTWVDSTRDQSALADGVYQFRAVVTDKAGNTATSNVEKVTVDRQTTAGSLSLTNYNDGGSSATDHISRDHSFKLALAGQEAGTTVKYQLSTDGGKTWVDSTRDQSALADGVYQFRAVVTDKAGNTATSNVETVTVDRQTTAGSLSLTSFNDTGSSATDHITRDHSFKLALAGQEAGTTVKYQLSTDGGRTWKDSTLDQSALADGVYQFRAVVTDKAGNTATSNVETVTVDRQTTAGSLSLTSFNDTGSSATDHITRDNSFKLALAGQEAGSTVQYQVSSDGGKTWVDSTRDQSALADGVYQFRAVVTDKAGNTATSNVETVTVDRTLDTSTIQLVINNVTADNTLDLVEAQQPQRMSGSLKNLPADLEGYQLSLLVGGQRYALTVDATTGQWSVEVPGSVLWQSENIQAQLQLTDKAGNKTLLEVDKAYTLNPVPEAPAQLQATIDSFADIVVTGTAFAGSDIKVKDAMGNVLASGTAKADGSFELFFYNGFVHGQQVNVTATVNGHESVVAQSELLRVPLLSLNSINQDGYLQGFAESGSVISIYDADHQLIKEFTFYPLFPFPDLGIFTVSLEPLAEGAQLFVVASKGGVESRTESVTVDFTPPAAATSLSFNELGQLTGQAEANSFIQVLDKNNNYVGSGQTDDAGHFVVTSDTYRPNNYAFNNGELLKVMVTDHNRNISDFTEIQAPDFLVAPQVHAINKDGNVSGVAEAGSSIVIKDATGKVIASTNSQPDGTFRVKLPDALKNGQEITVSATNSKGQTSSDSTVVVDFKAPAAAHDLVFNADGSLLIGKAEPFSTVNVSVDNQLLYIGRTVDANGNFTIRPVNPLHDGQKLTITVTDGNANESKAVVVTAPDYALAPVVSGDIGIDSQLQGLISEPNATIIVKDADGKQLELKDLFISPWGNAFTATVVSPLTHGQQVSVIAVDARGHQSKAVTVQVDLKAPKVATDVVVAEDGQTITGTAEANAVINVLNTQGTVVGTGRASADGAFNFKLFGFFLKGETLKVQVVDAAGNSSKLKLVIAPVDEVAPDVAQNFVIDPYGRTLAGTGEANSTVYVYNAQKQEVGSTIVGADGKFSVNFWNQPYVRGEQLTVVLEDRAGNKSQVASVIAPLDQTAPDKATGLEMQQSGNVLTGTAEPYSTVKVRTTWGEIAGDTEVDGNGSFTVYLNGVFLKGETLSIQVTDAAGNSSKVVKFVAPLDDLAPAEPGGVAVSSAGNVVSGQAEANSKIIIYNDKDERVGQTTADGSGQFSIYTGSNYFLKGEQLKVVAVDAAGNSSVPIFITAPVDTQAPEAATDIQIDENGNLVGNITSDEVTILLKNQAGDVLQSTSVYDGTFSFSAYQFELYQGQDLFVVVADHAGNQSDAVKIAVPVNADAPAAPTNLVLSDNGLVLSGTAAVGSDIRVFNSKGEQVSSYGWVDDNGNFAVQMWRPQLDGKPLAVYAYQDGKPGLAASIIAPLDNIAPDAPEIVNVGTEEGRIDSIIGFAEKGSVVLLKDENGDTRNYTTANSETGYFTLWGSYTVPGQKLTVVAVDAALNTSKATVVQQPVSPQAPAAATDLHVAEDGRSLSGSALAHTKVTVYNDGEAVGTAATDVTGHFTVTFDHNNLFVRGEALQVIVQKGPYYSVSSAVTAQVDTVAPDVETHLKMSADGHVVTGRAEANASVSIRDEHGYWIGDGKADVSGVFKITLYQAYTKGQFLNVQVTDRAGNESGKVLLVAPTDTTAPEIASNVVISANGLSISGRAEAGASIIVKDAENNQLDAWNTTVNSEGQFSLRLSTALSDGEKVTLLVVDSAGNQSPALELTEVANSPLSKPAYIWFDTDGVNFSGVAQPGTSITVKDKDGNVLEMWWENGTNSSGIFAGELSAPLEKGQVVYLTATDADGYESKSQKYVFEADKSSPDAASDLLLSPDGSSLTGSAEPLSRIEIRDAHGNYVAGTIVDGYGKFDISLSRTYQNGEVLKVSVTDRSGNGSGVASVTAPKDTVAPEAASKLQFSEDGSRLSGYAEADAYVRVLDRHGDQINYYDSVDSNGRFEVELYNHYLHGETLKVVIEDHAGNQSVAKKVTAPLDDKAPEAAIAVEFNQTGNALYGVAEAGAKVRILDADGNQVNYYDATVDKDGFFATSLSSSYLKGQKLTVVVEDLAGNQSAPVTVVAPLDKTAPAAPTHVQFNRTGENLTGFTESYATLTAKNAKGEVIGTTTSDSTGAFSFYFYKPLLQGQQVSVYAVDVAGNKGKAVAITAPLDTTAPEPASHLTIVDNYLQGTAESGATVLLKDATGLQFDYTTSWSGSFDVYIDVNFYQGQDIQIVVVDKAGNQSAAITFSVPVNPDAPTAATALVFSEDGRYLSGKAEAGSERVEVRDASGGYYEANIGKNGSFKVDLAENLGSGENLQHGEILNVRVVSSSGEYSPAVAVTYPLVAELQVQGVEDNNAGDIVAVLEEADSQQTVMTAGTMDVDVINSGVSIAQLLEAGAEDSVTDVIDFVIADQPVQPSDLIFNAGISNTTAGVLPIVVSSSVDVASLLHTQQLLV